MLNVYSSKPSVELLLAFFAGSDVWWVCVFPNKCTLSLMCVSTSVCGSYFFLPYVGEFDPIMTSLHRV